jgi:mono/diheme cytochrome c family protein
LDPKPASLADTQMMADLSEGYLFWRVSEGGTFEPFNSVMPTWKGILSEDERWQVISFIRTLGEEH